MEIKDPNRDAMSDSNQDAARNRLYREVKMDEYREQIEERRRDGVIRGNQLQREAEMDAKKRDQEWELGKARREAESYQSNKDRYRRNENNARTEGSRLFWQKLNNDGEAAEKRLWDLEHP
jgi:hypothetical protein